MLVCFVGRLARKHLGVWESSGLLSPERQTLRKKHLGESFGNSWSWEEVFSQKANWILEFNNFLGKGTK
jgi:hypothetical protein